MVRACCQCPWHPGWFRSIGSLAPKVHLLYVMLCVCAENIRRKDEKPSKRQVLSMLFHQRADLARWFASQNLNILPLWFYFSLSVGSCPRFCLHYPTPNALFSFHTWFPIWYFYPLPCAVGVFAWRQVQAIIFDLDGTLIDFEGGPTQFLLNCELFQLPGWLGRGLVSSFPEVEPLMRCNLCNGTCWHVVS